MIDVLDTETILTELNLDETEDNQTLINNLLAESEQIVMHAVNAKVDKSIYETDKIYQRAVKTLVTQLFYDRELSNGLSLGLQMQLNQLSAIYCNWSDNDGKD